MSFIKYLQENLKESHYAKGHYGDPQYDEPDYVSLNIPENFYALQLIDSDSEEIDTIVLPNGKLNYEFSEEDGLEDSEYNALVNDWKLDISKVIPKMIDIVQKKVNDKNTMEVYKQPWFIALVRDDIVKDSEYQLDLSKPLNAQDIQTWFQKAFHKDFNAFIGNDSNYNVVDIEARHAEDRAEAQMDRDSE